MHSQDGGDHLKNLISDKDQEIKFNEELINSLKLQYQTKTSLEMKHRTQLQEQLQQLKNILHNLEDKYEHLKLKNQEDFPEAQEESLPRFGGLGYAETFSITGDILQQKEEEEYIRLPRVKLSDV